MNDLMPQSSEETLGIDDVSGRGIVESVSASGHRAGALVRLVGLAKPFAWRMAVAVLLGFLTVASGMGLMMTSAYLISKAALRPSIAELQVAIVGVRFFGIARGGLRYLERLVAHDVTFRLLARVRVWFYQALEPLAPARLMQYRSGDLLTRIVSDVETLDNVFLRGIAPPAVAAMIILLATGLVAYFNLEVALVLLGSLVVAGVGLPMFTRSLSRRVGKRIVCVRSALNATLVDGIQGVADLLAFGRAEQHLEQVQSLSQDLARLQGRVSGIGALNNALNGLLTNLSTLAVLAVAVPLVNHGDVDGVYLALLVLAAISSFEAVLPISQAFQGLDSSLESARRLFEVVDTGPAVVEPSVREPISPQGGLWMEGLTFAYDPDEPPVLDAIDLNVPPGRCLAIVGPSGAGKSTLVQVLLRFWEYQQGSIQLGGRDLRCIGLEELRRSIAVVTQHSHLFNATVRDNLRLGRPDATDDELVRAAKQAQIHEFIQSLPEGYDTWIGEQGLRLSGGERQRLVIARAMLGDTSVLFLDEPTANLDSLTGLEVMGALRDFIAERTTLIITHRLVGLEIADEILVMRAGRVVERGRHHDLVQMGGLYARMWDLQRQTDALCLAPESF